MMPLKVYIGYDIRENLAYQVAVTSLIKHASGPVSITCLNLHSLTRQGLMNRPVVERNGVRLWDVISNAPQSTEFASSRFLTPLLAQTGLALFVDSDVVFTRDVYDMVREVRGSKAVYVVKHEYEPDDALKMDMQVQTAYPRKNWSSVMLFNCEHPANQCLNAHLINTLPGRDLHRFCWLRDHEIGELNPKWNWLVGEQPKPSDLGIAHFTLGGPWLPNWRSHEHDEVWSKAAEEMRALLEGKSSLAAKGFA